MQTRGTVSTTRGKGALAAWAATLLLLLGVCGSAEANWIDLSEGYFQDDVTGYTWMDTNSLLGMTPQAMQAALAGTGFQLATNDQIRDLIEDRGSTNWYGPGAQGRLIIGAQTNNAAWGYSAESLDEANTTYSNGIPLFRASLVRYNLADDALSISQRQMRPNSCIAMGVWALRTDPAADPAPDPVPEPATALLLASGLSTLIGTGRRRLAGWRRIA